MGYLQHAKFTFFASPLSIYNAVTMIPSGSKGSGLKGSEMGQGRILRCQRRVIRRRAAAPIDASPAASSSVAVDGSGTAAEV